MAYVSMKQMLETGVHFGHQTRRWNPKMRPFIFGARNGIHIIDLQQTVKLYRTAHDKIVETVANGGRVLFIGTKRQAQEAVAAEAGRATSEGLVGFELAADGKSGVAVEVKCETDFVARGDKFQGFVKDMVAQVAKGEYADSEALLAAPFVADASVTVKEALDGVIATTGENMGLGKFAKMELAAGKSGLIGGYLHSNGKLAVLVEMQTGSDAAATSEAFHEVAKNVAMQIAAASPLAVSAEGLNPEVVEHEREVYRQKAREEGKPEQIIEKIAEGAVKKFCKDVCLLDQLYIRDDKMTISDLIKGTAKTIGEPITVVRFVRIQLGAE